MSFIFKCSILTFITLYIVSPSAFSQFEGGTGSGYVSSSEIQVTCSEIIYSSIFNGGPEDGFSLTGITQRQCSPTSTPLIFNGGSDIGYSQVGIKQSMCSPGVFRNVFRGGSENSAINPTLFAGCVPIADFEASSLVSCEGDTINFTDLSVNNPTAWLWSFPGGNPSSSTVQNPSVVYSNSGVNSVSLTVTSLFGNSIITRTNYLTTNTLPLVGLSSISPLCINDSAYTLSEGSPTGGIYSGPFIASGVFDLATAGTGTHKVSYTFTNGFGCTNSDTANLIVNPFYNIKSDHQICNGVIYIWRGTGYTATGTYTANYTSKNGCDSVYTLQLTVNPDYAYTENRSICAGETYTWQGTGYTLAGTYTANYVSKNGCDSVYTLQLTVNPDYAYTENRSICAGETYTWQGTGYTVAGTYTANYVSINGCDSVYTLHLTVNPDYAYTENRSICAGETYTWQGTGYTAAGTYTANYVSKNGCDSVYTLQLTVNPDYAYTENRSICEGETYTWQGTGYTIAGTYTANYVSIYGCDSAYSLNLSVNTPDVSVINNGITITANLAGAEYQWVNCNNDFEIIAGATLQSFTITTNGNYAVIVKQGLCSDTSECIQVSSIEIGSIPTESITIYPNPVKNELFIEIKGSNEKIHLVIVNIMNQVFYEETFIEKTTVKTLNFPMGVYIIKLEKGGNINFTKFIKEE